MTLLTAGLSHKKLEKNPSYQDSYIQEKEKICHKEGKTPKKLKSKIYNTPFIKDRYILLEK